MDFTPDLAERFRNTPPDWPFVIHAAEGDDSSSYSEIAKLDALRVLDRRTVLVHAIALRQSRSRYSSGQTIFPSSGAPLTNLFTCGKTLTLRALEANLPVALGTDSPLTADGDMSDEIQCCAETELRTGRAALRDGDNARRIPSSGCRKARVRSERRVRRTSLPWQMMAEARPRLLTAEARIW